MIQLEKDENSEYSDRDIQEYVRSVYDYAADLRINQEMSWDEVCDELVNQGVDNAGARVVVDNLRKQERKAVVLHLVCLKSVDIEVTMQS